MQTTRFQIIEFEVASSGLAVKTSSNNELDTLYKHLRGVALEMSASEVALRGSKLALSVGNIEISKDDFPAGKYYGNFGVEPNKRFLFLESPIEAGGNKVEMVYTDGGNAAAYPYKVKMVFWLINPTTDK